MLEGGIYVRSSLGMFEDYDQAFDIIISLGLDYYTDYDRHPDRVGFYSDRPYYPSGVLFDHNTGQETDFVFPNDLSQYVAEGEALFVWTVSLEPWSSLTAVSYMITREETSVLSLEDHYGLAEVKELGHRHVNYPR